MPNTSPTCGACLAHMCELCDAQFDPTDRCDCRHDESEGGDD